VLEAKICYYCLQIRIFSFIAPDCIANCEMMVLKKLLSMLTLDFILIFKIILPNIYHVIETPCSCSSCKKIPFLQVSDDKCPDLKPTARQTCNVDNCPQWYAGIWSEVTIWFIFFNNSSHVEYEKFSIVGKGENSFLASA
jgi:hypothetical protein